MFSVGASFAYIETDDLTSQKFAENEGYSPEVYRLIRLTTHPEETREETQAYQKKHWCKTILKKTYRYIDPYMGNEEFGRDSIKFYPSWDEI